MSETQAAYPHHRHRSRVVAAVRELVAEQGLRVSMDAVAARAGCSKQTLYSNYGSRQNLLRSVVSEHMETTTRSLSAPGDDLRSALLAFAREHRRHITDPNTSAARRLLIGETADLAQEARDLYHTAVSGLLDRLVARLRPAMANGELRQADVHRAAELLLAMVVGLDTERTLFGADRRTEAGASHEDWAAFAVDGFLRAFAPP